MKVVNVDMCFVILYYSIVPGSSQVICGNISRALKSRRKVSEEKREEYIASRKKQRKPNRERFKNQLISDILLFLRPIAKAQTVRSSNQCAQKLSHPISVRKN